MIKTISRLAIFLLFAGLVVAACYALKPSANVEKRPAASHSQEVLSQSITALQQGRPNYARMDRELADQVRRNLAGAQKRLARVGPLMSLTYIGGAGPMDVYRAQFAKGSLQWAISLDKNGSVKYLSFQEPPTPQSWIDSYAAFPWSERIIRMAEQFGILLAAALFGRFALRLRL